MIKDLWLIRLENDHFILRKTEVILAAYILHRKSRIGHDRGKNREGVGLFFSKGGQSSITLHNIMGGNELLYMIPRFRRQMVLQVPEIAASTSTDGRIHITRSAIVGGNDQKPVIIFSIKVGKITGGSSRAFVEIPALVNVAVHFQAEISGRARHELPGTGRTYSGSSR